MNVAVSQRLEVGANINQVRASFRTERGRLYTIIGITGSIGGTIRVRYLNDALVERVNQVLQAQDPTLFAVASDEAGTIEITYDFAPDPAVRHIPLVVVKEITV